MKKLLLKFIKKFFQVLAIFAVILFATPFVLHAIGSVAAFTAFYPSLAETNKNACTHYYAGTSKGTIWSRGEWHHYVDIKIDNSPTRKHWEIIDAPLPSNIWDIPTSSPDMIRVSYRWPSNWWDPFPVSDWKVCSVGS